MTTKPLLALMFVTSMVLAGCLGSTGGAEKKEGPSETAAAPSFSDETGAITGVLVSEETLPVAGATVALQDVPTATTTSDEAGAFTLSNLPPGDHALIVQKIGFETVGRKVAVSAGQVAEVKITLKALAVEAPYYVTQIGSGYVQCSVRAYPGVPTGGAGGLPPWVTGLALCNLAPIPTLPPDKFLISYDVAEKAQELLLEMDWTSTQASGKGLEVVMEHDGHPNEAAFTFGRSVGPSPLKLYVNEVKMANVTESSGIDCLAAPCKVWTRVFAAANTTEFYLPTQVPDLGPLGKPSNKVDVGFVYDQKFTQYLTAFHLETKPDGFTALSDK